ncbi:N-acetylmuramoyl-L-alanine amidase [Salimicrobium halophilum]|uniref:N-acetylmuramoyl-L-alanine amidase n=1 Tax=Salimicrobium halophilum TaxID=86666 RepID=A0A1G8TVN4_9BACI|nr:N-acetylmuramoyl-L-alanine amidase [Salimicrobium halophilum]SDJ45571.1 N-acetylmuramoyl-L-alanine amidase [Salimicrobium halophilum]
MVGPGGKGGVIIGKQVSSVIITILFILSGASIVSAHEGEEKKVDASSLLLREAPDEEASVLGAIPGGETVTVREEKYGWANVDYNGTHGWVAGYYLVSTSASETSSASPPSASINVQGDSVRLRGGPGTSYRILGVTNRGDTFQVLEKENGWVKVRRGDGSAAWIAGWLTSAGGSAVSESAGRSASSSASSLQNATIIVDAGHGGYEPGAIGRDGSLEKDLTLSTSQTIASALRYAGADVVMTRTSDRYLSLAARAATGNSHGADAFVSVHYNSSKHENARGISTYYYGSPSLASPIQSRLVERTSYQDDGTRHGDFHVLRENGVPAVLLELGYVSNAYELVQAKTRNHREQVAQAVTEGLRNYFAD